jgi:small subunit ribosomal protein S7
MPRKKTKSLKRDIPADRKYNSVLVQKVINKVMRDGKKLKAEKHVYAAMELAATKLKAEDPLKVLTEAIDNVKPRFEVKGRRVGGANYQIPFEIKGDRQLHFAITWFVGAARDKRKSLGKPFTEALSMEIMDAHKETGSAVKKKEDTHKMAEANRAFAHFAKF